MLGPLLLREGVLHRRITGAVLCERQGSNAAALNSGTLDNRVVGIHLFFWPYVSWVVISLFSGSPIRYCTSI